MKNVIKVLTIVLIAGAVLSVSAPAHAVVRPTRTFVDITGVTMWSCVPGQPAGVTLDWGTAFGDTSDHYWTLTNLRTGAESSELVGPITDSGSNGWMMLPVPAGTQSGDLLRMSVRVTSTLGPDAFDSLTFYCATGEIYDGQGSHPVPKGFVQTGITCSTAVFDAPAGNPVGKNAVLAGQAWYLNPTPVTGPDGASWTEVFVAGPQTVYIPTECVGAPTGF